MIRRISIALCVVAVLFSAMVLMQRQIDAMRRAAAGDALLYIPSKAILKHLTAGMSNIVADLLWIETIQYTVGEFHNPERKFQWLDHMLGATTDLDPYFEGVYVHGGMFLSAIGRDERAMDYLKAGFIRNPHSWEIPHEIVKVYTLNRRDRPEAAAVAPYYLRMVAERHQHPQLYLNWARQIQERHDLAEHSREIWEDVIRNAKDPFVREMAQKNLQILVAGDTQKALQKLCDTYRETFGEPPSSLYDLVELGWIDELPSKEVYGEFILGENGEVASLRVLEDRAERMLMLFNSRIRMETEEHGRTPKDLTEFESWIGETIFDHPVPGKTWKYDPVTGIVS